MNWCCSVYARLTQLVVVTLLCSIAWPTFAQPNKPNIIVILTDDQGYQDVGFNGSPDIRTPHIDRIANEGVNFTEGYVTYPVCGPSRAGLLTGRYQGRFGFSRNPYIDPTDETSGLPLSEDMISEVLKPQGYTSAIVGKWHMGTHPQFRPNNRAFDYFFGFLSGGHEYFPESLTIPRIEQAKQDWSWYRTKILENDTVVEIDSYLTDELSDAAVEFIRRQKDAPFFLYLAYNAPHTPLQATEAYLARNSHIKNEKRRTYAAMITAVDDGVGRLLDTLTELNIDQNTLIFFLSDNGGATNNTAVNKPLRGFKGSLFEGGVRVPYAMRWPGKVPAGLTYSQPVSSLDILATAAAITNASIDPSRPLDGVNLIPYVNGKIPGPPHDILFWRKFDQERLAMRYGDYKIIYNGKNDNKLLYNLSKDISEQKNLFRANKRSYKKSLELMQEWNEEMIDPVFRPLQGGRKK